MTDGDKQQAVIELIQGTYECMGIAVLDIIPIYPSPSSFKVNIIDANGPSETIVTVLLQMNYVNKRQ